MNKIISATEARKNFFSILKLAGKPGASVTITLEGNPPLILLPQEEFEGWLETMEIMSDEKLMRDIRASMKEIKKGKKGIPWEKLKKELNL